MNPLKVKDIFLQSTDFRPADPVKPYPIPRDANSPGLFTATFTSDQFRTFWSKERVAFQWEYQSEAGFRDVARTAGSTLLPFHTVPRENGIGKPRLYDWSFRFQCRRHRPSKTLAIKRESIGVGCQVYIRMRKLVAEDRIQVEYSWRHNHDTSSEAMAKLPNGYNELQWTKAKVAEGLDWKDIKGQCRSSSSSPPPLQDTVQEADRQSDREGGSLATRITYDHYRRVIYRQQTGESRKSNDISTSVKRWMEQITKEGGKSMFEDHINDNPDNFIIAWSTPFQLKIMGENSTSAFIDTNDTAVKSIKRNVANSRVTTSAYLVTLLVTDKTIQGSVPIAYMICGSESSVVLEKWLTWLKTDCGFSASTLMVDCSLADVEIIKRGVSFISIYYDPFHVRKAWERKMVQFHSISEWDTMRPQLQQIRSASSAEKLVAAWNAFLTKFPGATEMIQYLGQWLNPNLAAKWVLYMREYQSPQHVEALEVAETWQGILKKHSLGKRRDMRADSVIFLLHGQIDAEFEELYSMAQAG